MQHDAPIDLTGRLLIAMPGMGDPRFAKAVILICAYGDDGAMGLIVNKPAPELNFSALAEQLSIETDEDQGRERIYFGGPVEGGRGFVLHSRDYADEETTLEVGDEYGMTATLGVLRAMAEGAGPAKRLVALGYAGWGPGQIEQEIAENGWLVADAPPDLVFAADDGGKWLSAIGTLGFDPILLSAEAGRA